MRKEKLELLQGTLDMLVLKTLTGGPLHGYNIVDRIQQSSSDVIKVEEGSLILLYIAWNGAAGLYRIGATRRTIAARSSTGSLEQAAGSSKASCGPGVK